jgi:hypothetical protein
MHTHNYLASIAQLEFDALVQDTERAIQGLRCQRESVVQAIEAVQKSNQNPGQLPDETLGLVARLRDKLGRLDAALDHVISEIEQESHQWSTKNYDESKTDYTRCGGR